MSAIRSASDSRSSPAATHDHQCRRDEREGLFRSGRSVTGGRDECDGHERQAPQHEEQCDRDVVRAEHRDETRSGLQTGEAIEPEHRQYPRGEASFVRKCQRGAIEAGGVLDLAT